MNAENCKKEKRYIIQTCYPSFCFSEKIVEPRRKDLPKYYHRQLRRVPTIDECEIQDAVCFQEANQQFKRDK